MKANRIIVTGANGHLGTNVIHLLNQMKIPHVALVRNQNQAINFGGITQVQQANLLNVESLGPIIEHGDIIIHAAANFSHWAKDPEKEIYQDNIQITENIIEVAKGKNVGGFVFISSLGAADRKSMLIDESGWNNNTDNTYFRSKRDSEKLAWRLTNKYNIPMISILPAAMIGGEAKALTPTMKVLSLILKNKMIFDLNLTLNLVDVAVVSQKIVESIIKRKWGERYLLASEAPIGLDELIRIAQKNFPEMKINTPIKLPALLTRKIIALNEMIFHILKKEPDIQVKLLDEFSLQEFCDISKAQKDLSFYPTDIKETVLKSYQWIRQMT